MTFTDVLLPLPNGLHDAKLKMLQLSYSQARIDMDLSVWVGDVSAEAYDAREAMRAARLTFTGVVSCIIQPPFTFQVHEGPLTIDAGTIPHNKVTPPFQLGDLPTGAIACWFYIEPTNSFIYVVAREADFQWLSP